MRNNVLMGDKKLPLRDRHAIKQALNEITQDSKIFKTKAGGSIADQLRKMKLGPATIFGKDGIKDAVENRDWKMAICIALEKNNVVAEVADILVEIYKKECRGITKEEREDQWLAYVRDVFKEVFEKYDAENEIPNDIAQLMMDAMDAATKKIVKLDPKKGL